ncbi:MAG: hypothetical protein V2A62_05660 [Candidatus Woesearchaeota archaeon]
MLKSKQGQVEVTFNWIYIVIAGAVILLFFAGIIVKQKIASEETLDRDVMRIMENIFTAAQVSENTKTSIDMGGLRDYVFYFSCEDGVSKYGLEGRSLPVEDSVNPIFAPSKVQSATLITWSVPYKLPFKVIDFLFITSSNTKYFLWGETDLSKDFLKAISNSSSSTGKGVNFNVMSVKELSEVDPGKNFAMRIVDFEGKIGVGKEKKNLPLSLWDKIKAYPPGRVTLVSFQGTGASTTINYYRAEQGVWKLLNHESLKIISLGGESDATLYAAIFSGDDLIYQCNMKKAIKRLFYLTEVYGGGELGTIGIPGGKLQEMINYYEKHPEKILTGECLNYITKNPQNLREALQTHQNKANACLLDYSLCPELVSAALNLRETNNNLAERGDCIPLY